MPVAKNPLGCGTRDVIVCKCTLQGAGNGNAPTLDAGGAQKLFGTPVRTGAGLVTIPLNESVVAVKITGGVYLDTNYDTVATRRGLFVRAKDTKTAKEIKVAIENIADGASNALADLAATQSFDFEIALHFALPVPS